MGTSNSTKEELNETEGFHHEGLGEFEKKALSTKDHHSESL